MIEYKDVKTQIVILVSDIMTYICKYMTLQLEYIVVSKIGIFYIPNAMVGRLLNAFGVRMHTSIHHFYT